MSKLFDKPTVYVSHPILGTNGDMVGNCKKATKAFQKVRKIFPEINWYVPSESDLVLQILYNAKILTVDEIIFADLKILRNCDGWCMYHFDESKGCERERDEAIICGLTHRPDGYNDYNDDVFYDISKANYNKIRKTFIPIVERTIEHFRRR